MRHFTWASIAVLVLALAIAAAPQQTPAQAPAQPAAASRGPGWAFPFGEQVAQSPRKEEPGPLKIPGSPKTYTQAQIDDGFNPPDWFPDEHPPMPQVVARGSGKVVRACANCHLTTGMGHPESAIVTGFSVSYFMRQIEDMKNGDRKTGGIMDTISKAMSEEDSRPAAGFFADLKPFPYVKGLET